MYLNIFRISSDDEKDRHKMVEKKLEKLKSNISEMESVVVAFSGGTDSSFLLKIAKEMLGENVLAVTAVSETFSERELQIAEEVVGLIGVKHELVKTNELKDETFSSNPPDKCYHCKRIRFSGLLEIARKKGYKHVIEGSNTDDKSDFRPGMKAVKELSIRSPLMEAGLTKAEIRQLSREMDLPTWDTPSNACLATRIPYGSKITEEKLKRIETAENYLTDVLGIKQVRVRDFDTIAKIEVPEKEIKRLLDGEIKPKIVNKFKSIGYRHITIDLEGYRTGSMNLTDENVPFT